MQIEIVSLEPAHLEKLMPFLPYDSVMRETLARAYFSDGSIAHCLLSEGEPVFAGGIVNMQWRRGEAWIIPTPFFKSHVKTCYGVLKEILPKLALRQNFRRVQAVCTSSLSEVLFLHLRFKYEGTMTAFGPGGEDCLMYARIFR